MTWKEPIPAPTDYVIKYKKNYDTLYTTLDDGINNKTTVKITNLDNNREYDFKVASKVGNNASIFTSVVTGTPSDRCSTTGADNEAQRCYATQTVVIKTKYKERVVGFSGTINFDEVNLQGGFNNAPYWLVFTSDSNGRQAIIEIGIIDDNRLSPKLFCAEDGNQQSRNWNARENVNYNIDVTKKSSSGNIDTWGLIINGNICNDIQVKQGSIPNLIKFGTETSFNNSPDFIQEFDNSKLKITYSNGRIIPYSLQSGLGSISITEIEPGYFTNPCGNTSEGFYHIETGKGVARSC